jgi:hypothetical protein
MLQEIFLFGQTQQQAILMTARAGWIVVIFLLIEVKIILLAMMTLKFHRHRHKHRHSEPLKNFNWYRWG